MSLITPIYPRASAKIICTFIMTKLVALNPAYHKNFKIDTQKLEAQGANERLIPVVITEFSKLVVQYPIAFTKSEETGAFICVAVLGFEQKENLFWENKVWDGIYTPLHVVRQPFFIGDEQGKKIICIDEGAGSVSQDQGEPLFDEQGKETEYLQNIQKMLAHLMEAETLTQDFIKTLLDGDLLVSMPLNITFASGESQNVRGFYTIDEAKLDALEPEKLLNLQKKKYLASAYMIIASTGHFYSLVERKNRRLI